MLEYCLLENINLLQENLMQLLLARRITAAMWDDQAKSVATPRGQTQPPAGKLTN